MTEPTIPATEAYQKCKSEARLIILQCDNGRFLARLPNIPEHWSQEQVKEFLNNERMKEQRRAGLCEGIEQTYMELEILGRIVDEDTALE